MITWIILAAVFGYLTSFPLNAVVRSLQPILAPWWGQTRDRLRALFGK